MQSSPPMSTPLRLRVPSAGYGPSMNSSSTTSSCSHLSESNFQQQSPLVKEEKDCRRLLWSRRDMRGHLIFGQLSRTLRRYRVPIPSLLIPSFLNTRRPSPEISRSSETAWLDGLRGLAAFIVYIRHFAAPTHANIQVGYGGDEHNKFLIQLPFLRIIYQGPAMVAVFFVISGYALALGPLRSRQSSAEASLLRLSSVSFRRVIRLFLPGIVSTFLVMLCINRGLFDWGFAARNERDMPGFQEPAPPLVGLLPLSMQLRIWAECTWKWLKVWDADEHLYDAHLWTIPIEFRCSMILFVALVAIVKASPRTRFFALMAAVIYCHYTDFWKGWLFFAGATLAQWKLWCDKTSSMEERSESPLPVDERSPVETASTKAVFSSLEFLRYIVFIGGIYLLCTPEINHGTAN